MREVCELILKAQGSMGRIDGSIFGDVECAHGLSNCDSHNAGSKLPLHWTGAASRVNRQRQKPPSLSDPEDQL